MNGWPNKLKVFANNERNLFMIVPAQMVCYFLYLSLKSVLFLRT